MASRLTTNYDTKAMAKIKFPPEFNVKVDMNKVNVPVIKKWVKEEIERLTNDDDDVLVNLVFDVLENTKSSPDIKKLQHDLSGFLGNDSANFCLTLWNLCIDASQQNHGIPPKLLHEKAEALKRAKKEDDEAREAARARQAFDEDRERFAGEGGRGEGGYGRGVDRGGPLKTRYTRASSPRARGNDLYSDRTATTDRYVPGHRGGNHYGDRADRRGPHNHGRSRSPRRSRSPHRSRSPRRNRQDRRDSPSPYRQRSPRERSPRRLSPRRRLSTPRRLSPVHRSDSYDRRTDNRGRNGHGRGRFGGGYSSRNSSDGRRDSSSRDYRRGPRSPIPKPRRGNTSSPEPELEHPPKHKRSSHDKGSRPASRGSTY